ncbi:hypothetical protein E2C01_100637 [Portunus trituberculatus]|uniref:Uncharacterized protein n=1 Tax=Portunus trituberculatus TaxID=210409 RepID=A0A5B7KDT0_PORTR|nr:hypothetical protein [Portunus trituberculatus]
MHFTCLSGLAKSVQLMQESPLRENTCAQSLFVVHLAFCTRRRKSGTERKKKGALRHRRRCINHKSNTTSSAPPLIDTRSHTATEEGRKGRKEQMSVRTQTNITKEKLEGS